MSDIDGQRAPSSDYFEADPPSEQLPSAGLQMYVADPPNDESPPSQLDQRGNGIVEE